MVKFPFERFLEYLTLARNKYSDISEYLSSYKIGSVNGVYMRKFESKYNSLGTPEELEFLESNPLAGASKKSSKGITIRMYIDKALKELSDKIGITRAPFDVKNVKLIFENIMLRRAVEVYLTTNMDISEICLLVNDKYRVRLTIKDIEEYEYWFYDIDTIQPDTLYEYFASLPEEEKDYKFMAYKDKDDYVKWRMNAPVSIDRKDAIKQMMEDAFFNFKESVNNEDKINHMAAKIWSDIFFKAMDCLEKKESEDNTEGLDIFKKFKFNVMKDAKKPISFNELINKDK